MLKAGPVGFVETAGDGRPDPADLFTVSAGGFEEQESTASMKLTRTGNKRLAVDFIFLLFTSRL